MIKEIVEFMDVNNGIEEYFIADNLSGSYLHYYIKLDKHMLCKSFIDIDLPIDVELKKILKYMSYYQKGMHNKYLDKNDGLGGSSPYILTFKLKYDGIAFVTNINEKSKNRIDIQFNQAIAYIDDSKTKNELKKLRRLLKQYIESFLLNEEATRESLVNKYNNQKKEKKPVDVDVRVYLDVGLEKVKNFYEVFVEKRAFLDTKKFGLYQGVCSICDTASNELSLPYILNSGSDDFGMKPTMSVKLINHVCKSCTLKLHRFKVMTDNNQLTKPFPLFIDNKSLFGRQTAILNDDEKKKSYREMIKAIWNSNPKDLKNFYLLNYYSEPDNGWKLQIKDIDYIENFEYMTSFKISNFMVLKNSFRLADFYGKRLSVFQFEKIVNELIFRGNLQDKYFSDYKDFEITYSEIGSKNKNTLLKNYLVKYRQNFYDFIYKSHITRLEEIDFREMVLDIIKDNIKHDTNNKNGYSVYENEIIEKLNLLFSIKHHFKGGGKKVEQNEFVKLKGLMNDSLGRWEYEIDKDGKMVLKEDGSPKKSFIGGVDHIENNDEFFAFLCGQMARFLIEQSEKKKENKNHSDFNAFTDWRQSKQLKEYIYDVHRKYAHKLKFNKRYDNAMCIIQTYSDKLVMDGVMEYMIAGYFADNQVKYQDNTIEENGDE